MATIENTKSRNLKDWEHKLRLAQSGALSFGSEGYGAQRRYMNGDGVRQWFDKQNHTVLNKIARLLLEDSHGLEMFTDFALEEEKRQEEERQEEERKRREEEDISSAEEFTSSDESESDEDESDEEEDLGVHYITGESLRELRTQERAERREERLKRRADRAERRANQEKRELGKSLSRKILKDGSQVPEEVEGNIHKFIG